MQDDNKVGAIQLRQELFLANGTGGQEFVFTTSKAIPPLGVLEVAYHPVDAKGKQTLKWEDVDPVNYTLEALTGSKVSFRAGYSLPTGTVVRIIYVPASDMNISVVITPTDDGITMFGRTDIADANTATAVKVNTEGEIELAVDENIRAGLKSTLCLEDVDSESPGTNWSGPWRIFDRTGYLHTDPVLPDDVKYLYDRDVRTYWQADGATSPFVTYAVGSDLNEPLRLTEVALVLADKGGAAASIKCEVVDEDGVTHTVIDEPFAGITTPAVIYGTVPTDKYVQRVVVTIYNVTAADRCGVASIIMYPKLVTYPVLPDPDGFDDINLLWKHRVYTLKTVEETLNETLDAAGGPSETAYGLMPLGTGSLADLTNVKTAAITIAATFDPAATAGIEVEVQSSYDGLTWDTEYIEGLAPDFAAGETVQITHNIDTVPFLLRVKVTNLDAAQTVDVVVHTTFVE